MADNTFDWEGGTVNPGPPPTWSNTGDSSKWVTLEQGLRQFVSPGETVDLSDAMFQQMLVKSGEWCFCSL